MKSLTASLTLDNLERVLPTADDVTLPAGTYLPNQDVSRIFTLNDIVMSYRSLNLTALADALSEAGTTHGKTLGKGVRLWEPIEDCPSIYGISIEIDVALFQNAEGPTGYMANPVFQQAWIGTGLLSRFEPQPDGSMLVYGFLPSNHHCGPAKIIERMVALDRVLVTTAMTTYQEVTDADALEIVDAVSMFALAKIRFFLRQSKTNPEVDKVPAPENGISGASHFLTLAA